MKKLYLIKPLSWEDRSDRTEKPINYSYQANTRFGTYTVEKNEWSDTWQWGYYFNEYYDEEKFSCVNKAEGIKLAEKNWLKRITCCLEELPK